MDLSRNAEAPVRPAALLERLAVNGMPVRRAKLVEELTDHIRSYILENGHAEGHRLPTEAQICAAASVSRTVVREAIASLKAEGLIETRQGSGAFVRLPPPAPSGAALPAPEDAQDIVRLIEFRLAVETEMAHHAAMRRTDDDLAQMQLAAERFSTEVREGRDAVAADFSFHHAVARASHNRYFVAQLEQLGDLAIPRQRISGQLRQFVADNGQIQQNDREHHAILAAIRARDSQQAAAVMRFHLGESLVHYRSLLRVSD